MESPANFLGSLENIYVIESATQVRTRLSLNLQPLNLNLLRGDEPRSTGLDENPKELWYVKGKDREIGMKPVYVEVITKVLITYGHCYRCPVAHGDPQIHLAQDMEIPGLHRGRQGQIRGMGSGKVGGPDRPASLGVGEVVEVEQGKPGGLASLLSHRIDY